MGLKWSDIDLGKGIIHVRQQVLRQNGEVVEAPLKTKNSYRNIAIGAEAIEVLRGMEQKDEYVFPAPYGGPMSTDSVLHMLQRVLKRAGLERIRFHDLRHTFATNALEHGMDVKTLSTIIGHVSSATTLNVYAHVTDDMQRQAADKIDRGIGKVESPVESSQTTASRAMTDFKAQRGKHRYWGSGYLGQRKGRWAGQYTIKWPDGKKVTRSVYASTEEECERLLAAMIREMKTEVAAEKERLRIENQAS